jgi:GDPmannose 4,6-dehydratase
MKRALVTGITGQDGAYLAQHLLQQGYEVYGGIRRTSTRSLWRLDELGIADRIKLVDFELLETTNLISAIREIRPSEIYNLAAQSFVGVSFKVPTFTGDVDGLSVARLLEAIRAIDPAIRFYQASTSEMFGKVRQTPQTEETPFYPRSPYAVAKLYGHWMTVNYRESYGMHACSGILFNHESPLRGSEFVTRKITMGLAAIASGSTVPLELGNTLASRDWGHARDYVVGMWKMLQVDVPDDFVLSTGETHTVEEFATHAAAVVGFDLVWDGEGVARKARDRKTGKDIIRTNPEFFRPAEVDLLIGNPAKAKERLDWAPVTSFAALCEEMISADVARLKRS